MYFMGLISLKIIVSILGESNFIYGPYNSDEQQWISIIFIWDGLSMKPFRN